VEDNGSFIATVVASLQQALEALLPWQGSAPAQPFAVRLEAEDGLVTEPMRVRDDGLVGVPAGDGDEQGTVELRFTIPTAGRYVVQGLVLAPDAGSNSFWVSLDGTAEQHWSVEPDDQVQRHQVLAPVDLAAGEHVLVLRAREDGTLLDAIVVAGTAR
jgi:hypothetical protein